VSLSYEQQPGESLQAFRAYIIYRDLGFERSLERAYAGYRGEVPHGLPPGQWNLWSVKHRWVARAAAYDAHLDKQARKERERQTIALLAQRFRFELRNQDKLERRVDRMDDLLDKTEMTPVADVVVVKDESVESMQTMETTKTRTKTSVKALKLAGYSRAVQVRNQTAAEAINGVRREKKKANKTSASAQRVTGIVYLPAEEAEPKEAGAAGPSIL
jgi:hypothetical protein